MNRHVALLFALSLIWLPLSAIAGEQISPTFARKPSPEWVKANLPKDFKGKAALAVKTGGMIAVLYKEEAGKKRVLSVFRDGAEKQLWSFVDHGVPIESALVPRPSLLLCDLNGNAEPDLMFCHSEDKGVGKESELWQRRLLVFVDGKQIGKPIDVSGTDFAVHHTKKGAEIGASSDAAKPATRRETVVILSNRTTRTPPRIYIWSRTLQYKTAKEKEEGSPVNELLECEVIKDGIGITRYTESRTGKVEKGKKKGVSKGPEEGAEDGVAARAIKREKIYDKVFAALRRGETTTLQ